MTLSTTASRGLLRRAASFGSSILGDLAHRWPGPRRAPLCCVLAALGGLTLAACGSNSSTSAGSTSAGRAPSVFTVGMDVDFHSLDPDAAIEEDDLQIINQIAGTLTRFTPTAASVVPGLAASWTVSANGRTYTFILRKGLKFSTGAPLYASDVVASFEREMTDKTNVNAGIVSNWAKVTAPSPDTVVLTLKTKQPSILSLLADPELGMVSPAAGVSTPKSFYLHPVSDGPYRVVSFDPADGNTTLTVNPSYYGPKPAVKEMVFTYVNDTNTRVLELKSGQLDLALDVPPDSLTGLTGTVAPVVTPGYGGWYIYVNDRTGVLANVNVRKAMSLAIDRNQLSRIVFLGKAPPMYSFWATTFTWYGSVLTPSVDVAQAKALLRGTPCQARCTLSLLVTTGTPVYQDIASIVALDLAKVGIHASLQLADPSVSDQDAAAGKYQMSVGSLYDYANRPDIMLEYGLQSNGGVDALDSGYDSPAMDSLIRAADATSGSQRDAVLRQIDELYAKDLPFVPLIDYVFANGERTSAKPWVTFEPSSFLYVKPAT